MAPERHIRVLARRLAPQVASSLWNALANDFQLAKGIRSDSALRGEREAAVTAGASISGG